MTNLSPKEIEIIKIFSNEIKFRQPIENDPKEKAIKFLNENSTPNEKRHLEKFCLAPAIAVFEDLKRMADFKDLESSLELSLKKLSLYFNQYLEALLNRMPIQNRERYSQKKDKFKEIIQRSPLYSEWAKNGLSIYFDNAFNTLTNGFYFISFNPQFDITKSKFHKDDLSVILGNPNYTHNIYANHLITKLRSNSIIGHTSLWDNESIESKFFFQILTNQTFLIEDCICHSEFYKFKNSEDHCYALHFEDIINPSFIDYVDWHNAIKQWKGYKTFIERQDIEEDFCIWVNEIVKTLESEQRYIIEGFKSYTNNVYDINLIKNAQKLDFEKILTDLRKLNFLNEEEYSNYKQKIEQNYNIEIIREDLIVKVKNNLHQSTSNQSLFTPKEYNSMMNSINAMNDFDTIFKILKNKFHNNRSFHDLEEILRIYNLNEHNILIKKILSEKYEQELLNIARNLNYFLKPFKPS